MVSTVAEQIPDVPIARPTFGVEEFEALQAPLRSGWVTQGPEVAAFEAEFAAFVGARHACAVSNCTSALHLALLVAGVGPGDEVVTASHSFIATANAIRYCGAVPVFVDIDPQSFNLDPEQVERAIGPRTRAILCVHQMGMPCDLAAIAAIARRHDLPLVEDAACAVGSEILRESAWERIGRPYGDVACFSFHPRKVITTGDGGMLTTDRADWDRLFRRLRHHGMSVSDHERHGSRKVVFEEYPQVGFNYRLTDLQAAVGRVQLRRLPSLLERRRALAQRYAGLLGDVRGLVVPHEPSWARTNWQSYCVRLPPGADQHATMSHMLERGIATRRGIHCAHREKAYSDVPLWQPLPHSEQAQDHCILLPIHAEMSDADQDRVASALREALRAT